jgi:hypothetical protein
MDGASRLQEAPRQPTPRSEERTRRRTPSVGPALIVVGLAVLILILFGIGSILSGNSPPPPVASSKPQRVPGTPLLAVSAAPVLRPIEVPGAPPANIVSNLTVPEHTTAIDHMGAAGSTSQYDAHVDVSVHASQGAVVSFYRAELPLQGWKIVSVGPVQNQPQAIEVLGQKAGDDGWYWEIGAVVEPTTFPSPSAPVSAESTRFALRLFQRSDESA